ncbi:MAG: tRNA (adenosine(37)-N6)-threonylcarbamoyltransferase complex dimerization subunit type 1 TsaB [Treponema sp.]|jgi:tRNA threonylcarbamoyladenosine biosynthesis protein TsaB|nr:tRNA (adenosine(37)-N6)-threonylcarbamoyltransferase complex dimerization subunit type 1 TsaB [Treponema sp.]
MNLLAIDAAASVLSVAVSAGETFSTETEAGVRHSEIVMGCIDELMKKSGLSPKDLDGVVCMGGPGSFTGLRIGFSIAKGLALSLAIPFAAVPTLDCIALPHCDFQGTAAPVIAAGKNSFFYALYRNGERLCHDAEISVEKFFLISEKTLLTGPGAELLYNLLPQENKALISVNNEKRGYSKELIEIAKRDNIFNDSNKDWLFSGPEYIKKTDAEIALSNL